MQEFNYQFRALGNVVNITTYFPTTSYAERSFLILEKEFLRIHLKFFKNENSIISKLNLNAGIAAVDIVEEVSALLDFIEILYKKSNGEFNCLDGALREVWNLNPKLIPDSEQIKKALKLSKFSNLNWSNDTAYISEHGSSLDLSPILIGYALERALEICKKESAFQTLIRVGQQFLLLGHKPDGDSWNVALKHPRSSRSILFNLPIELKIGEFASIGHTGDFINYNFRNQERITDILSPTTGYPKNEYQSCWIKNQSPLLSTCLSRTIFLLGEGKEEILNENSSQYILVEKSHHNSLGHINSNLFDNINKEAVNKGKLVKLFPNPSSHHHSF